MRSTMCAVCVVIVAMFAPFASSAADDQPATSPSASYGGQVPTRPVVHFMPAYAPGTDTLDAPYPDHPPIDEIPAMPMPSVESLETGGPPPDPSNTVYDAATGETFQLPVGQETGEASFGGGYQGPFADPDRPLESEYGGDSFGALSQITTQGSDPWRVNAKLVMEFETTTGTTLWYVCSGSMQDAEVVLTASHCVYARNPDGNNIYDWAQEIWVYPGWDGVGSTHTSGTYETYGYGRGNYYQASTAWINSGDFTYDVGLVRINRAVGALTGSWGWAQGFSCATVMARTMNNTSYPAEGCGQPGLHNGRDMYYMFGTVDDCNTTNRFHIITSGGCFNAVWGGMSGSAMYYIDNGSRYAEAVTSTSNRATDAYYARLWSGFVDDMNNSFIPGARTATFDLQALNAIASPTTITAGQAFSSASFFTTNSTNGSTGSTNFPLTARLSTNEILSSGDTLLQTTSFTTTYSAMQSRTITFGSPPTIPLNTPSGNYWFGVVLDPSIDTVSSNNNTLYWDAQPVTVNGVADLVADWLTAPSGTFHSGDPLAISYNIDNAGGDPSNTITVQVRASTNTTISGSDPLVASYSISGLSGGGTTTRNVTPSVPAGLSGSYYIGMIISASDDVNSSNNTTYDATPITIVDSSIFSDGFESGNVSHWSSHVP